MARSDAEETMFKMKRSIAQDEINAFSKWIEKPGTYNEIRLGIGRFFIDPDWMDAFLQLVDFMEASNIEAPDKCPVFINGLRRFAIIQHSLKIMATNDTVTIMGSALAGDKPEAKGKEGWESRW